MASLHAGSSGWFLKAHHKLCMLVPLRVHHAQETSPYFATLSLGRWWHWLSSLGLFRKFHFGIIWTRMGARGILGQLFDSPKTLDSERKGFLQEPSLISTSVMNLWILISLLTVKLDYQSYTVQPLSSSYSELAFSWFSLDQTDNLSQFISLPEKYIKRKLYHFKWVFIRKCWG